MSEESQKNRSPNSPKFDLNHAIDLIRALHTKIGRSAVKAEIAAGALGYNGMNGAALGTLGAISQYGLVDRTAGNVQVTDLALRILHPLDDAKKNAALKEAALYPKVFGEIHEKWNDMSEDVLANHLIHQRFTPEAAKRAASIYKLNYDIAKLSSSGNPVTHESEKSPTSSASEYIQSLRAPDQGKSSNLDFNALVARPKMLANFKIPIGAAEAEIIFTGERLEAEDFDALRDYVDLFKKQYVRKVGITAQVDAFLKGALAPTKPTTPSSEAPGVEA